MPDTLLLVRHVFEQRTQWSSLKQLLKCSVQVLLSRRVDDCAFLTCNCGASLKMAVWKTADGLVVCRSVLAFMTFQPSLDMSRFVKVSEWCIYILVMDGHALQD